MTFSDHVTRWWQRRRDDLTGGWEAASARGMPRTAVGAAIGTIVLVGALAVGVAASDDPEQAVFAPTAGLPASTAGSSPREVDEAADAAVHAAPTTSTGADPFTPEYELAAAATVDGYDAVITRDPFERVVPEPQPPADTDPGSDQPPAGGEPLVPPTDGTAGSSTAPGTELPDGTHPGTTPEGTAPGWDTDPSAPGGSTEQGTGTCFGGEEVVCDGKVVSVVPGASGDLPAETILLRIDDETFEARPGDVIAQDFLVAGVANGCASIQYRTDAFLVCEPEPGSK